MTSVHSLSGRQIVRTMMLRELRLGDLTLREQPVAVIARETSDPRKAMEYCRCICSRASVSTPAKVICYCVASQNRFQRVRSAAYMTNGCET